MRVSADPKTNRELSAISTELIAPLCNIVHRHGPGNSDADDVGRRRRVCRRRVRVTNIFEVDETP